MSKERPLVTIEAFTANSVRIIVGELDFEIIATATDVGPEILVHSKGGRVEVKS